MTTNERRAFVHEVISGRVHAEDFPPYTEKRFLAEAFGPSKRDEPPTVTPDELVEQHLKSKPDRLAEWLRSNADPKTIMEHATPQEFSDYMEARAKQQTQRDAEEHARVEAKKASLVKARAALAAKRAKSAQENNHEPSSQ